MPISEDVFYFDDAGHDQRHAAVRNDHAKVEHQHQDPADGPDDELVLEGADEAGRQVGDDGRNDGRRVCRGRRDRRDRSDDRQRDSGGVPGAEYSGDDVAGRPEGRAESGYEVSERVFTGERRRRRGAGMWRRARGTGAVRWLRP